jgi:serpin B
MCLLATLVPTRWLRAGQSLPVSDDMRSAARSDTAFTLDLYRQLAAESADNLILSGHSVKSAFLILAAGATGRAAEQIGSTLRLPDWSAQADAHQPWNFADYSRAFAELQRSMEPIGEDETSALKERLAELNAQNELLDAEAERSRGPSLIEVRQRQREIAAEIETVSQQIDPYQLRFANAVWCDTSFPLSGDYSSTVESIWGAAAFDCDFINRTEQERQTINEWVAGQTEGRIEDLLPRDSISTLTRLVITNAMYFKGTWQLTFNADWTTNLPFFSAGGLEVEVPMMMDGQRECRYVELTPDGEVNEYQRTDEGWQLPENPEGVKLLELPYRGGRLSMVVVLPNDVAGLSDIESRLDPDTLETWLRAMREQTVAVYLPKFTMTGQYILNDYLQALGMTAVFAPGGLTGLSDASEAEELAVSLVAQKAFIEVTEEGTEAAAATAIVVDRASLAEPKPNPEFRADHPFLYFIQDRETGAILFMGRLNSPEPA